MNVSHANRCPDCHRVVGVVESNKPKARRFCWVRNGAICMQTQLAYERALLAPLRLVLERARAAITVPLPSDGAAHIALVNLAEAVVRLDAVEPPLVEENAAAE